MDNCRSIRRFILYPSLQIIEVEFFAIDLEESRDCRHDGIHMYDGSDESAPLIGSLCGHYEVTVVRHSLRHLMFVTFVSDFSIVGHGFNATFHPLDAEEAGNLVENRRNTCIVVIMYSDKLTYSYLQPHKN